MSYNVTILADSIANGQRLTTVSLTYPRFIHSEFLRHRTLSHSVESSRAVPTERYIERVREEPFVPETFNQRVKGMGVGKPFERDESDACFDSWLKARDAALAQAESLNEIGLDKSRVNRLLEPFMFVTDLVTGTDWDNFFALRDHEEAQPEFQIIARMAREAFDRSEPLELMQDEWHLPLVDFPTEWCEAKATKSWSYWAKVSAGRCCRWSYGVDAQKAMAEYDGDSHQRSDRLLEGFHMSPFEHQASPFTENQLLAIDVFKKKMDITWSPKIGPESEWMRKAKRSLEYSGNLRYWNQFRKSFVHEENFGDIV